MDDQAAGPTLTSLAAWSPSPRDVFRKISDQTEASELLDSGRIGPTQEDDSELEAGRGRGQRSERGDGERGR